MGCGLPSWGHPVGLIARRCDSVGSLPSLHSVLIFLPNAQKLHLLLSLHRPLIQARSPWLGSSKPDRQFQRCSNTGSGSCLVECACVCTCVCMFYSCLSFFSPSPCSPNNFPVKLISLAAAHHLGKALGKQRPP